MDETAGVSHRLVCPLGESESSCLREDCCCHDNHNDNLGLVPLLPLWLLACDPRFLDDGKRITRGKLAAMMIFSSCDINDLHRCSRRKPVSKGLSGKGWWFPHSHVLFELSCIGACHRLARSVRLEPHAVQLAVVAADS